MKDRGSDRPTRITLEISRDLEAMVDRLRADTEASSRSDVIRRALSIMTQVQADARNNASERLGSSFEREIFRSEREEIGKRLYPIPEISDEERERRRRYYKLQRSSRASARAGIRPRNVFISYAREDLLTAKTLYHKLRQRGHEPWLDTYSLKKGADWQLVIKNAIRDCEFFVALCSSRSVKKTGFVQIEVHDAAQQQLLRPEGVIYFIPIKIDDCELPSFANKFNYIDLSQPHPYKSLFDTIEMI